MIDCKRKQNEKLIAKYQQDKISKYEFIKLLLNHYVKK